MPTDTSAPFNDRAATTAYADRTRRLVPGYDDMLRMAGLLAAERAPADASILVVGAGGGAEIATFARLQPQWRFVGVDPAQPMLDLARETLGPVMEAGTAARRVRGHGTRWPVRRGHLHPHAALRRRG
jgi:tRNA (cmo5U34)-methyltransferase